MAGHEPIVAPWAGYFLTMVFALVITPITGVSENVLILYGLFGVGWALWLSVRWRPRERELVHEVDEPKNRCPSCSHENDLDAQFCVTCGRGFAVNRCPECDTRNDPIAAYCKQCGGKLAEKRRPPAMQRRKARARKPKRQDFSCFECGADVKFGASHCGECGEEFSYLDGMVRRDPS